MSHTITANQYFERIVARDQLRAMPIPRNLDWLHPWEREELDRLRDHSRRESWLFGRWLAKQLILEATIPGLPELASIAVISRNEQGQSVRPVIFIDDATMRWSLTISHSDQNVAAILVTDPNMTIGVDLAPRDEFSPGLIATWFTQREQKLAETNSPRMASLIWAAKEAIYKVCNTGEGFAPHRIEIILDESGQLQGRYLEHDLSTECRIESRIVGLDVAVIVKRVHETSDRLAGRSQSAGQMTALWES